MLALPHPPHCPQVLCEIPVSFVLPGFFYILAFPLVGFPLQSFVQLFLVLMLNVQAPGQGWGEEGPRNTDGVWYKGSHDGASMVNVVNASEWCRNMASAVFLWRGDAMSPRDKNYPTDVPIQACIRNASGDAS